MNGPDRYTHAWYHQQMAGMEHLLKRLAAEYDSQFAIIAELRQRIEILETALRENHATTGDVLGRLATVEEWQRKASERLNAKFAKIESQLQGNGHV